MNRIWERDMLVTSGLSRRRVMQLDLATAATIVAGVSPRMPGARAQGSEVRIGFQKGSADLLVLKSKGLLDEALGSLSATVTWTEFPAGPPLLEALNAGALDFGTTGAPPSIVARPRERISSMRRRLHHPPGRGDPRAGRFPNPATELYEQPATEFVLSFVGKVNRVGDAYIRPHEVGICHPDQVGCLAATIDRVIALGLDYRLELSLPDGARVWAQMTREEKARLRPLVGEVVGVDLSQSGRPGWEPGGLGTPAQGVVPATIIPMHGDRYDERQERVAGDRLALIPTRCPHPNPSPCKSALGEGLFRGGERGRWARRTLFDSLIASSWRVLAGRGLAARAARSQAHTGPRWVLTDQSSVILTDARGGHEAHHRFVPRMTTDSEGAWRASEREDHRASGVPARVYPPWESAAPHN